MSELVKAILLGIVEGVTEFLPVSSTGHLIVASAFLNFPNHLSATFDIVIQFGAVLAVVFFYAAEIRRQGSDVHKNPVTRRFWLCLALAVVPVGLVGFLLKDWIKAVLFSPVVVAVALVIGGVVMILVERRQARLQPPVTPRGQKSDRAFEQLTFRQALFIGVAQMFALIPGVSRSAASIIAGLLVGMERGAATQFSFFLAIPTLLAVTGYDFISASGSFQRDDLLILFVGLLVSAVVAWLSIRWLLGYVSRHTFVAFGYYRIAAGLLLLLLLAIVP